MTDATIMTRRRFATLAGTGIVAAPAIIRSAVAAGLTPFTVGYDGFSITTGPMYYGMKKGIFKKYGLDLSITFMNDGTTLTQAIVGGSYGIGQNGYTPALAAAVQGADDVLVGSMSNKLPFQLTVKKDLATGADFKGKKIAVTRMGASSDTALTFALAHLGLKRSDVVILQLGGEGNLAAALMSGQIDGCMIQMPRSAELEETGRFKILIDGTVVAGDYPNTAYVSRRSYLREHGDIVKQFFMGISDSIHQYKQDRPGALALTAEFLKGPNDKAMGRTYDLFTQHVFPDIPYPSLKGMQLVLNDLAKTNPKAAQFKPEQLVDTTAIDTLVREGFYKQLLGKA
jgi:NitT/TauT family transport system substrate-binding protein